MKRGPSTIARLCGLAATLIILFVAVPDAVQRDPSPAEQGTPPGPGSKGIEVDPHLAGLGVCRDHGTRESFPAEPVVLDEPARKNFYPPFGKAAVDTPRTWTVLFYDDADFAGYDPFRHFADDAHSDINVNVVVLRDNIWGPASVFYVDRDHNRQRLEEWGEVNMGSGATLKRFIQWGKAHYPADRYFLAMYDHGGGWMGACVDVTNGGFLTMREIAIGIGEAGGVDILAFTAPCLMGAMESVYEVRDCVDVYIADEDVSGYIYWLKIMGDICDVLNESESLTNEDIGRKVIELVEAGPNWDYDPSNEYSTMSAVSTSRIGLAAQQLGVVGEYLSVHTALLLEDLESSRASVWELGAGGKYNTNCVDLFDYTMRLSESVSDPFLLQSLQYLRDLLDDAIIAECDRQPSTTRCPHGLSLYFPSGAADFQAVSYGMLDFARDSAWDEFLRVYYQYLRRPRGNIGGSVAAGCPNPDTPLEGVTVTACQTRTGDLLGAALSGEDGSYTIRDLLADEYTVAAIPPIGYGAETGPLNVSLPGGPVQGVDISLGCTGGSGSPSGTAFWRRALREATRGVGQTLVDAPEMCAYLDAVDVHFTSKGIDIYAAPTAPTCEAKLAAAADLLDPLPPVTTEGVAKCHLMALLLNVAAGHIHTADVISKDGATVSQAITHCYNLLTVRPVDALVIADLINNGCTVTRGRIPLSTPNIAFAPSEQPLNDYSNEIPLSLRVSPNPFNPTTTISFSLPQRSRVTLAIYDVTGRRITTLVDQVMEGGPGRVVWNGTDARRDPTSSGVYFYRLEAGETVATGRMLLIK